MRTALALITLWTCAESRLAAQDSVRLIESFPAGYQYRVSCRVDLEGTLRLPATRDQAARSLKITGKSAIEYQERILGVKQGAVDRTVRKIQRMEFARTVDGQEQASKLRPEVALLVIQRLQSLEVPFSPQGPLTWSEIELTRTDVFAPALAGLLPRMPVRAGDDWPVDLEAVRELTDLEKITKGGLTCRFVGLEAGNPRLARVGFKGTVTGIGEDGPAQHELDGYFLFDLQSHHLGYLSLGGVHRPLDKDGQPQGEIRGTFTLTREPAANLEELTDQALARWSLTANDDNTQLLFESSEVKFLYSRNWRVEGANPQQIRLVERQGSDLLITLDPPGKLPATLQLQKELVNGLLQQKARLTNVQSPRSLQAEPHAIEHFNIEAQFSVQPAAFDYFVVRQPRGGATLTVRSVPAQAEQRRREIERLARSMALQVK